MYLKKMIWASVLSLFLVSTVFSADKYTLDPVHTSIEFSVRHLVINNVKGKFTDFSGTLLYDDGDITKSSVNVSIKAASVNTGTPNRDNDLRSANFLDAEKFPEITFQSQRIEKRGDGYVAVGTLTIHGVSKETALPFSITGKIKDPWGGTRMGIEVALTLNRRDFGMNYGKTLDGGGLVVGNDVKIEIAAEAVKAK
jgi:polyisoprenoid-binding protein YceI